MTKVVDARGLSCPQPVIRARAAIDAGEFPIEVLVDTATSRDSVTRMAERAGFLVLAEQVGEEFKLTIHE